MQRVMPSVSYILTRFLTYCAHTRASMPDTGEAVVATRMIECVRDMSYESWPSHSGRRQKSCTALPRW